MVNKIENTRILITGGAGFIGSHIAEHLLHHHPARIYILDNLSHGSFENMRDFIDNPLVEFYEGDIRDTELLDRLMARSAYVFHLAALDADTCAADPAEAFDVMMRGTFEIAESARRHDIRKVIYASDASVYGQPHLFPTPETHHPYGSHTLYDAAKLYGEQLFRAYKTMYGLDYIALRCFSVYGPRMDASHKDTGILMEWLGCIRDGKNPTVYGDGSATLDLTYAEDVARASINALLADATGEAINIGRSRETSIRALLTALLAANESALEPVFAPADANDSAPSRQQADVSKAKALLRFTARTLLEDGLKKLSDWYFEKQLYPEDQ